LFEGDGGDVDFLDTVDEVGGNEVFHEFRGLKGKAHEVDPAAGSIDFTADARDEG